MEKLECVGHVQKCLGSRLRSLKKRLGKTPLQDGKSISGRGRLTNSKIDKLQVYYEKAIRDNTHGIESMQKAVMAIWHHTKSTNENPDHDLCPPGAGLIGQKSRKMFFQIILKASLVIVVIKKKCFYSFFTTSVHLFSSF